MNTFICELNEQTQNYITNLITLRMTAQGYSMDDIRETISNVLDERLENISDNSEESILTDADIQLIMAYDKNMSKLNKIYDKVVELQCLTQNSSEDFSAVYKEEFDEVLSLLSEIMNT